MIICPHVIRSQIFIKNQYTDNKKNYLFRTQSQQLYPTKLLKTPPYPGNTPLATVEETFEDGVVTSEFVIDSFSNSDIGSYSCRLENDGTTDTASRDSIVLAIQGL